MKKLWPFLLIIAVAAIAVVLFVRINVSPSVSSDSGSGVGSGGADYDNDIVFNEELEGAELSFKDAKAEDFYGSWVATSGQSLFMYGNVDLTISDGGKWHGNVAGEDLEGSWDYADNSLNLSNELFNAKLSFTKDGKLIMQEDREGNGEYINAVLSKK